MGPGGVVEDGLGCRLRLLAEQGGHWAGSYIPFKEVTLQRLGSQPDGWNVIPENKLSVFKRFTTLLSLKKLFKRN